MHRRYAVLRNHLDDFRWVLFSSWSQKANLGSDLSPPEQLPHGHVKSKRRLLQNHIPLC
ncbi:hypothetical protein D3C81_947890 [compost metagenome]